MKAGKHVTIMLSAVALTLSACAGGQSAKAPEDKPVIKKAAKAASYQNGAYELGGEEGFVLSIRPVHMREQVKSLYKVDIVKRGYMPYLVKLENRSYDGTIRVHPERIHLLDPDGNSVNVANPSIVSSKSQRSYGEAVAMGMAFGPLGAGAYAAVLMGENDEINERIVGGSLREKPLSKGESVEGYIYFPVPNEMFEFDGWSLVAKVDNPDHKTFELKQGMGGKMQYRGNKPLYMVKKDLKKRAETKQ